MPFGTTDEYFAQPPMDGDYPFTACGRIVLLNGPALAAALSMLPQQKQEEVFRYYFRHDTQKEIGNRYGQTRSTAGHHIRLALQQFQQEMEVIAHYVGYIRYCSHICGHFNVDMEDYIKTKLIESQFKFRFDR